MFFFLFQVLVNCKTLDQNALVNVYQKLLNGMCAGVVFILFILLVDVGCITKYHLPNILGVSTKLNLFL